MKLWAAGEQCLRARGARWERGNGRGTRKVGVEVKARQLGGNTEERARVGSWTKATARLAVYCSHTLNTQLLGVVELFGADEACGCRLKVKSARQLKTP